MTAFLLSNCSESIRSSISEINIFIISDTIKFYWFASLCRYDIRLLKGNAILETGLQAFVQHTELVYMTNFTMHLAVWPICGATCSWAIRQLLQMKSKWRQVDLRTVTLDLKIFGDSTKMISFESSSWFSLPATKIFT